MDKRQTITLQASGNDFTVKTESHSNKMKFTATVMYLDQYSDGVPDGSVWEKILLEKSECEKSLETMNLMGINCVWDEWGKANWQFDGHDPRNKIGVVENTYIEGNELKIDGIIFQIFLNSLGTQWNLWDFLLRRHLTIGRKLKRA